MQIAHRSLHNVASQRRSCVNGHSMSARRPIHLLVVRSRCISFTARNRCLRLRRIPHCAATCPIGRTTMRTIFGSIACLSPLLELCGGRWESWDAHGYPLVNAAIPACNSSPRPTTLRSSISSLGTLTTRSWLLSLRNRAAVNATVTIATTSTAATTTAGTGIALMSMCYAQRWACSRQPDIPAATPVADILSLSHQACAHKRWHSPCRSPQC